MAVVASAARADGLRRTHTPAMPEFLDALRASGSALDRGGSRDLYDELIGSWDAEVVDHLSDGKERRQSAEVHFAWVLEGRAIQDLWIAPARADRVTDRVSAGNRYGTTLRVYDPAIDAWRMTWINPVTGAENRLVGRRVGAQIVQTGSDPNGRLMRWVIAQMGHDAFHWRGELSADGGITWSCDTEFVARRRSAASARRLSDAAAARHVSWEWKDRPGLEALSLETTADGVVARSSVVVALDGVPVQVRYDVQHDGRWRFQEARVEARALDVERALHVRRLPDGRWEINGALRSDLDGCEDVDLMATPYTNTPPLAAHPLKAGESRTVRVAWIRFPGLEVRAVEQRYTRLDAGTDAVRYRYENLQSGFAGDLNVDAEGLVIDYGPWKRR